MRSHNRKRHARCSLDDLICRSAAPLLHTAKAFWRLIFAIRASSWMLRPWAGCGPADPQGIQQIVLACARMASHEVVWHRPPEEWTAPASSSFMQFRSFVNHLFDRYPTPNFMAPVWLCQFDKPWERELYLHLAGGQSIRKFIWPVPVRLSKAAARFFMQAPDDLPPIVAVRWGQVRSVGGDSRLAGLLAQRTFLGTPTDHEEFWESVVRFFIKHAPISDDEILEIVDFIREQRFLPAREVWGPDAGDEPLDPTFSIQGRSLQSLRRHMANWRYERMARLSIAAPLASDSSWRRTHIAPYRHADGDRLWSIEELLNSRQLRIEGGIMQHCVARYIHICARRQTSIWSMKVQEGATRRRVLTIEVLPESKTIWQAKGKKNAPPDAAAKSVLDRWAEQEGLRFRDGA